MEKKKPNIMMVVLDEVVTNMTGIYGSEVAITPHMDRLGNEGVVFDNAYSSCPICSPARMSLLAGKYVSDINANDNMQIMGSEELTHNHYLALAGYETVLAGKLHSIGPDQLHGFEKRLNTDVYPSDFNWLALCREDKTLKYSKAHPKPIALDYTSEGSGVRQWSLQFDYDEESVHKALEYIRKKRTQPSGTLQKALPERDDRPFFLEVALQHPHEPFHCLKEYWDLYEGAEIPIPQFPEGFEKNYSSMDRDLNVTHGVHAVDLKTPDNLRDVHRAHLANITYCDDKIGQLIKELERCGLRDDTILIVTSDHGDMLGHKGMIQKRCFYEPAAKIPLIFNFPKNHRLGKTGIRCGDPVSTVDVCPTMCDLGGFTDFLTMDGVSLRPQLNGKSDKGRFIFSENHSEGVTGLCFMVRQGKYKYNFIYQHEGQLFDIENDPEEWENLVGKSEDYKVIEAEMKDLILQRFDIDKVEKDLVESIAKRRVMKKAHDRNGGVNWDYQPYVDASKQYWRKD
jgi:choline-sulfatase